MTDDKAAIAADTTAVRQLILGYQAARALLAADELGLVELLGDGVKTAEELAQATDCDAPSLYRLLRALATIDLVAEDGDGRFTAGPLAPGLRDAARIGVESYRAWAELPHSLRTGEPAFDQVHGKSFYAYLAEDPARAGRFDAALAAVSRDWAPAVFEVYDFSAAGTVADIGGGRGSFLAELLRAHPHCRGILFDQPQVVEHAGPILAAAGVAERCRLAGGSFFESVPSGAEVYTLCNLLTDWDDGRATEILGACRRAMADDGRVLVIDRILPPPGHPDRRALAFLDLFFLVLEGGRIRSREEFEGLLAGAGFRTTRVLATASTFSVIEGVKA
jgi:hypothetical protein